MPADLADDVPMPTASRLWWAVPAVGLILLALVGMVVGGGPEKVDYGTSYDATGGGFRAAYLLLEELKYPVERSRRPASGGAVRWVLFPQKVSAKEGEALGDWVRRGGVLLLAANDAELAGHLGLTVTVTGAAPSRPKDGPPAPFRSPEPAPGESVPAAAPDVTRLLVGPAMVQGPPGGEAWSTVAGRPLVTVYQQGRGAVWLVNRPDVLANANLRGGDNAVLTVRLADAMLADRTDARLAFDEYHHGLRDRPDVFALLLRPPVLGVTLQALLLAAAVLWHSGVRFGPVRTAPPPARRSQEEYLDAMAELLARKGDRAEAFRTVRDDFVRQLEADLGLPAGSPPEQTAREADRRGLKPAELLPYLTAGGPPGGAGPAAFLAALHHLELLAHERANARRDRRPISRRPA